MTSIRSIVTTPNNLANRVVGMPGVYNAENYSASLFGTDVCPFSGYAVFMLTSHMASINNIKALLGNDAVVWTDARTLDKNHIRLMVQKYIGLRGKQQSKKPAPQVNGNTPNGQFDAILNILGDSVAKKITGAGVNNLRALQVVINQDGLTKIGGIGAKTARKIIKAHRSVMNG